MFKNFYLLLMYSSFGHNFFQYKNERIQDRILEYAKLERKIEMHVPYYEVQALMRKRDKHLMEKQIEMENKLQPLKEGNKKPNNIVFDINTFKEWIDSTRRLMDDPYSDKSKTEFNQVITYRVKLTLNILSLKVSMGRF